MAKLTRVFQQIFGGTGDQSHYGQFGSRAAGTPLFTKDPATIQALTAFLNNGWKEAINAGNKAAFLEDMNGLFLLAFRQIAYGFQEGIAEWDSSTPYFVGGIAKKTGTFELYGSLVNDNIGNPLPSQTNNGFWQFLNPPSVAPGIMSDFAGSLAPFGYLLCDGSVYAQASYPALFSAIGSNWNTGGEGVGNFRVPDIRGRVTMGSGTGSGLSPRALAQLLGEESHVLVVGEIPANLNVNDPGHTHQGDTSGGYQSGGGATSPMIPSGVSGNHAGSVYAHTTGITVGGGGGGHNNIQPSAVVTKVIKT